MLDSAILNADEQNNSTSTLMTGFNSAFFDDASVMRIAEMAEEAGDERREAIQANQAEALRLLQELSRPGKEALVR